MQYKYMTDVTVSFRIDKSIHSMMKMHDEINWSAIIRKTVAERLNQLNSIDKERALNAARNIDKLRRKKVFVGPLLSPVSETSCPRAVLLFTSACWIETMDSFCLASASDTSP